MVVNTLILVGILTIFLYIADLVSQYLYVHIGPGVVPVPHNARWFFIHSLGNCMTGLFGSNDLIYCISHTGSCALSGWNFSSFLTFIVATVVHLYHVVFFWSKLSKDEWFHHGIMLGISGPLSLYFPSRASTVAICFLTGYPGMIDYFLLWLVKMQWLRREREKVVNAWINVVVRSPGCLFASFLGIPLVLEGHRVALILTVLCFWNGQYYMVKSLISNSNSMAPAPAVQDH